MDDEGVNGFYSMDNEGVNGFTLRTMKGLMVLL